MTRPRVVVCGAGPAGAAAAYRLARRGTAEVVLVEASERIGGHAASITLGGRRVDLGSHRLHPSCAPEIRADLERLLGEALAERPRNGRIRLADTWVRFPLRPLDLARSLPPSMLLPLTRDLVSRRSLRGDSFGHQLVSRFGPALCEAFWFPYCRKLWGVQPWDLSPTQATARVSARSGAAILGRMLRAAVTGPPRFAYPRNGFGSISEALVAGAAAAGADVRTCAPVSGIRHHAGRVRSVCTVDAELDVDVCLSTLPLPLLARITDPAPPDPVVTAAGALEHRAMVLVYFVLDVDRFSTFDAHYLPDDGVCVSRLSEPANYGAAWPAGRTVLCAEVPCSEGDNLWSGSDDEVARRVRDDLARSDLGLPVPASEVSVVRLRAVYPLLRHGFEDAVAALEAWVGHIGGLVTLGRQGLFVHDNSHHAMEMGYVAADCVTAGGDFDTAAWARAKARFAKNVVED